MSFKEVRQTFIKFFESKKHTFKSANPIVNKNDPTLMFTNAGMNQFKSFFLGEATPSNKRIVNSQPCLRVSGKHNDLEEVGIDTYHHTLFEMLGNWSFGDYFKEKAIKYAWELITEIYKLPKERIYVTVFEGDKESCLASDKESVKIWKKYIAEDRILFSSKKDNFWEMGDTGPCGPCSEIHFDNRSEEEIKKIDGKSLVNKDHPLVIEIWNLVFIEYNRLVNGNLEYLPQKHVDTGMGLERLLMILQNKRSTYDTDLFKDILQEICNESGFIYGENNKIDIAIRVIADHCRAITLTIGEGLLPSNNQEGYVIRRILRRAVRYAYSYLNMKSPFIYKLVPIVARQFEDVMPGILKQELFIMRVIKEEESLFIKTLSSGIKRLNSIISESTSNEIDGKKAFELYDTYGFPLDLTSLILKEKSYKLDEEGFKTSMLEQKNRSKEDASIIENDWVTINEGDLKLNFIGYESLTSTSKILKYKKIFEKGKIKYKIILDKTPFYPEGGGQVGDTGFLISQDDEKIQVIYTCKENDVITHFTEKIPENLKDDLTCQVDKEKRLACSNNHTATHLLHAALCQVLGKHVSQKGSLVNENLLRFDFSHFAKLTENEIIEVENIVKQKIRENIKIEEKRNVKKQQAVEMGARALFGEKYGDLVRVIIFDKNFSIELCGGTHAQYTGQLGYFKILTETSISSGIRRIEAITATAVDEYFLQKKNKLNAIAKLLKNPVDLTKAVELLIEENKYLTRKLDESERHQLQTLKKELISEIKSYKSKFKFLISQIEIDNIKSIKNIGFEIKKENEPIFIVLTSIISDKPHIMIFISEELARLNNFNASELIDILSKEIDGGGGGQSFFASAGGKKIDGLKNVEKKTLQYLDINCK